MTTKEEQIAITKYDLLYEQRMTRVETTLEHLDKSISENFKEVKSDLRWMLGIWVSINAIMLGLMAHGFHWF